MHNLIRFPAEIAPREGKLGTRARTIYRAYQTEANRKRAIPLRLMLSPRW